MTNKNPSKENYYGTSEVEGLTYLEFGGVDLVNSKKEIWDFKTDQDAYDLFMIARYAKEIIGYQDGKKALEQGDLELFLNLYNDEIHTKDFLNSILTWLALGFLKDKGKALKFYELGFTLFGCIEAHEACKVLFPSDVDVKDIDYTGNEISYLISELAIRLHSEYKVSYTLSKIDKESHSGLFFSKGVTLLYALKEAQDLMDYLEPSQLAIFDYNFSLEGSQSEILGTGKKIVYLSLEDFREIYKNSKESLFIRKSDLIIDDKLHRMRCHCLWGEEAMIKEYLEEATKKLSTLRTNYPDKFISTLLSDYNDNIESDYINLHDLNI